MKIGLVVNGRVASTRLRNKMLLPMGGKTFMERVLIRARQAKIGCPVIFFTTHKKEDNVLANLARSLRVPVVRGHISDVLQSYLKVAKQHALDATITWDGDDLFLSRQCLLKTKELLLKGADYVRPQKLPYGTFSYGMSTIALQKIFNLKNDKDTQGWGRYFTLIPGFRIADYTIKQFTFLERLRLTLDYEEDYRLLHELYCFSLGYKATAETFAIISAYAKLFPESCEINQNRVEEYKRRWKKKYSTIHLKSQSSKKYGTK